MDRLTPVQQVQLALLRQFLDVCQKLDIPYYLTCGSCLGAVKYGGFIPWDDDVDVALLRPDYERFLQQAPALLPGHLFLQHYRTDPAFPALYSKLRHSGTAFMEYSAAHLPIHQGIGLDIFPLDGYPQQRAAARRLEGQKGLFRLLLRAAYRPDRWWKWAVIGPLRLLGLHRNTSRLVARYEACITAFSTENAALLASHGGWQRNREYAPASWYGSGCEGLFEGISVRLPREYDQYLRHKYGNYTEDPPLSAQKSHHAVLAADAFRPYSAYLWKKDRPRLQTLVFISNYFNHHQLQLCDEFYRLLGEGFRFVETESFDPARQKEGWNGPRRPYVLPADAPQCSLLIQNADAVIIGSAPDRLIVRRLGLGRLTFRCHERWYRLPLRLWQWPRAVLGGWLHHGRHSSLQLLCAGGYVAADAARVGCFRNKCYKWGYFPPLYRYDPEDLVRKKQNDPPVVLWVGRLLELKQPQLAIDACGQLRHLGLELKIIGSGPLEAALARRCRHWDMNPDSVLLGNMPWQAVRSYMEQADIFLFTSDRREGWGAVLNEAMNSGCAVIASHAPGAVPYLIRPGENGLVFPSGDAQALTAQLQRLLTQPQYRLELGRSAQRTIMDQWNGEIAARQFLQLYAALRQQGPLPAQGPGSAAPLLMERDYLKEGMG